MADHARDAQAPPRDDALLVEMAAVEIGIGDDRAARHLVEGDVLGREVGRAGDHHRVAHAPRVLQGPRQRLHAAEAAAHHRRQLLDAQRVQQPGLGVDPVLHRDHRKVRAVDAAGVGVHVHRPGRAEARSQVVDADDEEAVGVHRLARADHGVPPALGALLAGVGAGDVVRRVERMADEHRVAALRVQRAVGLVRETVVADRRTALQGERLAERHRLRRDDHGDKDSGPSRPARGCGCSKKPGAAKECEAGSGRAVFSGIY